MTDREKLQTPGRARGALSVSVAVLGSLSVASVLAFGGCASLASQSAVQGTTPPPSPSGSAPEPEPTAPQPLPTRRGALHEVRYYAGSSGPTADIVIRRSSGQLDEQTDLAMPLESQSGKPHLTVRLPSGSEAVIEVTAGTATATAWCKITIDGVVRDSTEGEGEIGKSKCRYTIPGAASEPTPDGSDEPSWPVDPQTPAGDGADGEIAA